MARGFESKAVADQQAEAEDRRSRREASAPADPATQLQRRRLELARADTQHRLDQASDERYRAMLKSALADLDGQISALH
jgi:hypothetical protein